MLLDTNAIIPLDKTGLPQCCPSCSPKVSGKIRTKILEVKGRFFFFLKVFFFGGRGWWAALACGILVLPAGINPMPPAMEVWSLNQLDCQGSPPRVDLTLNKLLGK